MSKITSGWWVNTINFWALLGSNPEPLAITLTGGFFKENIILDILRQWTWQLQLCCFRHLQYNILFTSNKCCSVNYAETLKELNENKLYSLKIHTAWNVKLLIIIYNTKLLWKEWFKTWNILTIKWKENTLKYLQENKLYVYILNQNTFLLIFFVLIKYLQTNN